MSATMRETIVDVMTSTTNQGQQSRGLDQHGTVLNHIHQNPTFKKHAAITIRMMNLEHLSAEDLETTTKRALMAITTINIEDQ